MKLHLLALILCASAALAACQTSSGSSSQASRASERATASEAARAPVRLQPSDASRLTGVWRGQYVADTGFAGETTLTLSQPKANSVQGFFEYRWEPDNYARYPKTGTITGLIDSSGHLKFDTWSLRAERDGEKVALKTRQEIGGRMSNLTWRKDVPKLASEGAAPANVTGAKPIAETPAALAAFSGVWTGTWGRSLDGTLTVAEVRPDGSMSGIYAWGDMPGRFEGGSSDVTGQISEQTLTLAPLGNGARVSYEMQPDGTLRGKYLHRGRTTVGSFSKSS